MNSKIKHNIILIGFMGSGKTSVGKVLAKRLSYHFCDTDQMLEQKTGDTISHLFSLHGEEYFRDLETNLLIEMVPDLHRTVLSTGGGLPIRPKNTDILKEMGYVIFLKASKATTVSRLLGDATRPLLQGDELETRVEQMLEIRTPMYEKAAHEIIVTDNKSVQDLVDMIMDSYFKFFNI